MLETVARQTAEQLAVQVLEFTLPDPSAPNFDHELEQAWLVCDRVDLQTDIWRGRLLRSVRDKSQEGTGGSFERWLATKEVTRSRAYRLIELAECADRFLNEHPLQAEELKHFSKAAFVSAAKAEGPVQVLVAEQARRGERVTQRQVEQFKDQWLLANETILPEEVRERVANATLPVKPVAQVAQALADLPDADREVFYEALNHTPDLATLRQVAQDAQAIGRTLSNLSRVQVLAEDDVAREALREAARIGVLAQTMDLLRWATRVERSLSQLYTAWQRLGVLHNEIAEASGASTRALRQILTALEPLIEASPAIDVGSVRLSAQLTCAERWPAELLEP